MNVLVGYATAHGSTREIAERIATRLQERELRVVLQPMEETGDVRSYGALVLGSAIHDQAWLPEAIDFLRRGKKQIAARPTCLFSVGMSDALPGAIRARAKQDQDARLRAGLAPLVDTSRHRLFSGVAQATHFPLAGRLRFKAMGGRYGDYRNWPEIDAWAAEIADQLAVISGAPPPIGDETPESAALLSA